MLCVCGRRPRTEFCRASSNSKINSALCQSSGRNTDLARFSPKLRWCVLFPITDSNGKRTSRVKLEPGKPASILRPESDIFLGKFPATWALRTVMAGGSFFGKVGEFLFCVWLQFSKNNGALSSDDCTMRKWTMQHSHTGRKDQLKSASCGLLVWAGLPA